MKKTNKRLKLVTETVRSLDTLQLAGVAGGYPTETERASGCEVTKRCPQRTDVCV